MNQSIINALNLLDLFTGDQHELSLSDIHKVTDMSKPTVYRLLASLEFCGFLIKVKHSDQDIRYRLGLKLLELGNIVSERLELRRVALPHMEKLRDEINEIVHLVIINGDQATYIEKVESSQPIRLYTRIGRGSPLYIGSGPRLLFAYMSRETRENLIQKMKLYPLTNNTITDKTELRTELENIRRQGYAISYGEQNMGTTGISFPVKDFTGEVVAALTINGPSSFFEPGRESFIREKSKGAADHISQDLGYKNQE
ncbi:MAG TPA: IclR family transcriptional regulator [Bacillales bacterium]